jgi:hypothetical protein
MSIRTRGEVLLTRIVLELVLQKIFLFKARVEEQYGQELHYRWIPTSQIAAELCLDIKETHKLLEEAHRQKKIECGEVESGMVCWTMDFEGFSPVPLFEDYLKITRRGRKKRSEENGTSDHATSSDEVI